VIKRQPAGNKRQALPLARDSAVEPCEPRSWQRGKDVAEHGISSGAGRAAEEWGGAAGLNVQNPLFVS
jgi:hypothetical protein